MDERMRKRVLDQIAAKQERVDAINAMTSDIEALPEALQAERSILTAQIKDLIIFLGPEPPP